MTINWKTKILSALPFLALATHALRAQPADVQPANAVPPASTLERAFIYAFPIYEMMRVRWNYVEDPKNPLRSGVNGDRSRPHAHRSYAPCCHHPQQRYRLFEDHPGSLCRARADPCPRHKRAILLAGFLRHFHQQFCLHRTSTDRDPRGHVSRRRSTLERNDTYSLQSHSCSLQ